MELFHIIDNILTSGYNHLGNLADSGISLKENPGSSDVKNEIELSADKQLAEYFIKTLSQDSEIKDSISKIVIKNQEKTWTGNGSLGIFINPLNGSLNFLHKSINIGLPYTSIITITDTCQAPKLKNIITSGIIDLRTGFKWISIKNEKQFITTFRNLPCNPCPIKKLNTPKTIIVGEICCPQNKEILYKLSQNQTGGIKNLGSPAYEMALIATGQVSAYICDHQEQLELGAAYTLIQGLQHLEHPPVIMDWQGKSLDENAFSLNTQTPVIITANQAIANQILEKINQ